MIFFITKLTLNCKIKNQFIIKLFIKLIVTSKFKIFIFPQNHFTLNEYFFKNKLQISS